MEIKLKKYDGYKNSGVEWLGEIPEHWEVKRFRNNFKLGKGLTITKENLTEEGIFCVNYGEIHSKYGFEINPSIHKLRCVSEEYLANSSSSLIYEGDFIFADTSEDIDGSGNFTCVWGIDKVFAGYHTIIARPANGLNSRFLSYLFDSLMFRRQIQRGVNGVKVYSITQTILKRILIWLPPEVEQTAIAKFLDDKTQKIDQAIRLKQEQIFLLKERRQVLIHQAVTRGLDKNVKLKDSGVEWIGEIPEGWEVKRFRNIFNLSKGLTITKENLTDEGISCVNYGEIHSKYGFEVNPTINKLRCVSTEYLEKFSNCLLNRGDFVFADTSEDIQGSGNFTYLNSDQAVFAGYHTVIARPNSMVFSRFFAYECDTLLFRSQIQAKVKGVKVYSITQSLLKELLLWLPQEKEQIEISKHLDRQTYKIDTAISLKEKEIEKLKEYKASLINGLVTGKVRVG